MLAETWGTDEPRDDLTRPSEPSQPSNPCEIITGYVAGDVHCTTYIHFTKKRGAAEAAAVRIKGEIKEIKRTPDFFFSFCTVYCDFVDEERDGGEREKKGG